MDIVGSIVLENSAVILMFVGVLIALLSRLPKD